MSSFNLASMENKPINNLGALNYLLYELGPSSKMPALGRKGTTY